MHPFLPFFQSRRAQPRERRSNFARHPRREASAKPPVLGGSRREAARYEHAEFGAPPKPQSRRDPGAKSGTDPHRSRTLACKEKEVGGGLSPQLDWRLSRSCSSLVDELRAYSVSSTSDTSRDTKSRAVGSAGQPKPHQGGPGDHPPGAGDAANRAGGEVLDPPGKFGIARRSRIDELLDWREASPSRVVGDEPMMGAELAAVALRVGPQGSIDLPIRSVQESRADFLSQPIRRLERPAAANAEKRIRRPLGEHLQRRRDDPRPPRPTHPGRTEGDPRSTRRNRPAGDDAWEHPRCSTRPFGRRQGTR